MTPPKPLALHVYNLLARASAPLWRWGLLRRLQCGKETEVSIQQKLGLHMAPRPMGQLVWGHAVGVGESMALAGLFARLGSLHPELNFLITTTARTSGEALHRNGLPARCLHQFAPVDTPNATALFLDHWQPSLAVWCEMDLWPALIDGTDERRIPRVLINARLSASAVQKRRWGAWIYQALMPGFKHIFVQNKDTVGALEKLGAVPLQMSVSGNIKSLAPPLDCEINTWRIWQKTLGSRPVWLLASSHPGEETLALQAQTLLRETHIDALLIIAPRAPARGAEVHALCDTATPLRSRNEYLPTSAGVYIADTVGEMGLWYRLASVALIGGSIAKVGGHNPFEPLALSCAVLHGPNVWNFAESYQDLDTQKLAQLVFDPKQIADAVAAVWLNPRQFSGRSPIDNRVHEMVRQLHALLIRA
jgi:3-deoxy-D-manno-octulosonic-acid transferase